MKKLLISLLACLCIGATAFGFASCSDEEELQSTPILGPQGAQGEQGIQGEKGEKGDAGVDGKSAYELYCQAHPEYTGTMEEWIASLKGATGVGIQSVTLNANGDLVITLTDGTTQTVDMPTLATPDTPAGYSDGLAYTLSEDATYYAVRGLGICSDRNVRIPNTYKGLPVKEITGYAFDEEMSIVSVTIPNSVESIGESAFVSCENLTSVEIPDSVTTIGSSAFAYCDSLTSVVIPDSATSIGSSAFAYCENLTSVEIPDSVTTIGERVFFYCDSLTSVVIPDSVTTIGSHAFNDCRSLTSVVIPNSVTTIGDRAFYYCDSLTSVVIGDSVTTIGRYAFACCYSLTSVEVSENNSAYKDVDDNLYSKDGTVLIQYAVGKAAEEFSIPESVTTIGDAAFYYCDSLTSVVIPDSVITIGYSAFYNCYRLTSVVIGNNVTTIREYAFYECDSLTSVYYKGTAHEWALISIDYYGKSYLTNVTRYYYIENEADVPTDGGKYWHYGQNGEIAVW